MNSTGESRRLSIQGEGCEHRPRGRSEWSTYGCNWGHWPSDGEGQGHTVEGLEAGHRGSVWKPQDLRSPCWLLSREVNGMAGVGWGTWALVLPQYFRNSRK